MKNVVVANLYADFDLSREKNRKMERRNSGIFIIALTIIALASSGLFPYNDSVTSDMRKCIKRTSVSPRRKATTMLKAEYSDLVAPGEIEGDGEAGT